MPCDTQKIREQINNIIDTSINTGAKSIIQTSPNEFVIRYGNNYKVKNRNQAYNMAVSKVNTVNRMLTDANYNPNSFGPYVTINTSYSDTIIINKTNFDKLIQALELRNRAESEDRELQELLNDELLRDAENRQEVERVNNLGEVITNTKPISEYTDQEIDLLFEPDINNPPTGNDKYDKILLDKKELLKRLQNQLKSEKDIVSKEEIRDRINKLKSQIDRLASDDARSLSTILEFMYSDLKLSERTLDSKNDKKSLDYVRQLTNNYVQLLTNDFTDLIELVDDATKNRILEFIADANRLTEKLNNKYLQLANASVKSLIGNDVVNINGTIIDTKDISSISKFFLDTSVIKNPIVKTLTKVIKNALEQFKLKFTSFKQRNNTLIRSLKEFQKSKGIKDIYDFMIQYHDNKKTGNFISRLSYQYNILKQTAFNGEKNITVQNAQNTLLFYANNHTYNVNDSAWKQRESNLVEHFKANYSDTIILTDLDVQRGITFDEKLDKAAYDYAHKKNPYTMKAIFDKVRKNNNSVSRSDRAYFLNFMNKGGNFYEKVGDEYITPLERIADDKFIDSKWSAIQIMENSDPRKLFYNHFVETINNGRRALSQESNYLPWNYIPEKLKPQGFVDSTRDWAYNNLAQSINSKRSYLDPLTGEIEKTIPIYSYTGKLSAEDKSYNLGEVIETFAKETINYEEMAKIEDESNLLLNLLKKQKVYQTNPDGSPVIKNGEIQYAEGISKQYEAMLYRVNATLYGDSRLKEGITNIKINDIKTKQQQKDIKNKIEALELTPEEKTSAQNYIISGTEYNGPNSKIAEYITLAQQYKNLNSNVRNVTATKIFDQLLNYTGIKFLGLNLFAGFGELLQGTTALFTESASGKYFTDKEALKGFGRAIKALNPVNNSANSRLKNFAKYFGIESNLLNSNDIKDNTVSKIAFSQYRAASLLANGSFLYAMLEHETIKDSNNVTYKLIDVLEVDSNGKFTWNKSTIQQELMNGSNYSDYTLSLVQKYRKIISLNRERSSFDDPILLEKNILGRVLGQFKKNWLFTALYNRFGDHQESIDGVQDEFKGFYRSFFDLFHPGYINDPITGERRLNTSEIASIPKKILVNFYKFSALGKLLGAKSDLSQIDQQNLKKFMRETSFVITIATVMIVLSSMSNSGDDDDKFRRYAINQLLRLQRDLTLYMNPSSFTSLFKSPAPVVSTITDLLGVGGSLIKSTVLMDPYTGTGNNERLRIVKDIENNIPLLRQVESMKSKFEKEMDYIQ